LNNTKLKSSVAMALRKTTAGDKIPKAKKASTIKKSEDKVIKRPARGYHKFRNGLLNVAPKGDEKELWAYPTS